MRVVFTPFAVLAAILVLGVAVVVVTEECAEAAFPGGNNRIAFSSAAFDPSTGGEPAEIYTMRRDGSEIKRLTHNGREDLNPAWSADGTKIAFERLIGRDTEIFSMNRNGSGKTQLTDNSDNEKYPTWSADGNKIAFTITRVGGIRTMNADGTGEQQLTDQRDTMPTWSPDGTRLAFVRVDPDAGEEDPAYTWEIFVVNADGTGERRLTNSPDQCYNYEPDWSPDGEKIAFEFQCDGARNVWTMNAEGTGAEQLGTGGTLSPAWSPDGKRIAFQKAKDGFYDIFRMDVDGTDEQNLTNSPGVDEQSPNWGPAIAAP